MGRTHRRYLTSEKKIYGCAKCKAHLAIFEALISRQFNGQTGRAYLFESVVNVDEGPQEDRHMTTGMHTVRDVSCSRCKSTLGWKYDRAYENNQKYKEGKYILEKALLHEIDHMQDDMTTVEYDVDQEPETNGEHNNDVAAARRLILSADEEMLSTSSASL